MNPSNAELAAKVHEIERIVDSFTVRDILRLVLGAPGMVRLLLEVRKRDVWYYEDQLRRLDQDLAELRGRRSVEIEAAGREGYRQAAEQLHAEVDSDRDLTGVNLGLVIAAAIGARANVVEGELAMVGRSRAS